MQIFGRSATDSVIKLGGTIKNVGKTKVTDLNSVRIEQNIPMEDSPIMVKPIKDLGI
jgi:hypothetical protein